MQGLGAFNSISSTTVVGGVNTSGSSYIFYFKTDALAPGKVTADVNLPIARSWSRLDYDEEFDHQCCSCCSLSSV